MTATPRETEHTPGPWEATDLSEAHWVETNHRWGIFSASRRVAKVEGVGGEYEANARLIAAAPDLLEALKAMVAITNDSRGVDGYHLNGDIAEWDEFDAINQARAALAKAGPR